MNINPRTAGVSLIVAAVALAAAYQLGRSSALGADPAAATPAAVSATTAPAAASTTTAATETATPSGHPAVPAPQREGKVGSDPQAKFTHFRVGSKNVKRILVDGDFVWVGTSGGVIRYDTRSDDYKLFDTKSGLLSNGIFFVGKLDDRIAIGTYGGGLAMLEDATAPTWKTYNVPEGLGDAFVYDVLKARNGDVWIATWSGANRIKGGKLDDRSTWELHTVDSTKGGLPNDWVYGLAEGKDGEIWLATEGGLARWRDAKWDHWSHAQGLGAPYERVKDHIAFKNDPSKVSEHHARQKEDMGLQKVDVAYNPNYIVSMVVDAQGVVWAGTWGGGLTRFDGRDWKQYTVAEGLPGNHVFMLHLDARGTLWAGTNNGLARMQGERFDVMTTADGLFNNTVFSMATGRDGSLWVGSFGGVARIKTAP